MKTKTIRMVARILTLAVIAHGLQACATKRHVSQSKFDNDTSHAYCAGRHPAMTDRDEIVITVAQDQ